MRSADGPTPAARGEMESWLRELEKKGRSPLTVKGYRTELGRFLAASPGKQFSEFAFEDVMAYLNALPEAKRPRAASVLRGWFRWGEVSSRISDDPTRLVPPYKWQRAGRIREIFSEEEIRKLEDLPYPNGVLMEILFETGIKTGEAQSLVASCCELDSPNPQLRIVEGRYPRVIPISDPQFRYRLAHYITNEHLRPEDHLWFTRPGGGRSVRRHTQPSKAALQGWWTKSLQQAGVPHRMMRTTRNTFARRMRAKGVDLDHLQLLLGHNDYYTTSEYYSEERYPSAEVLVRSAAGAEAEAVELRDLLRRVLPHLVTQASQEASELAKEIGAKLTRQG